MPGAVNLVIDDEPVGERPTLVGAMRADGEDFGPAANKENLLLPHAADELSAVWKFGKRNSLGQIRGRWPGLVFRHSDLLRQRRALALSGLNKTQTREARPQRSNEHRRSTPIGSPPLHGATDTRPVMFG